MLVLLLGASFPIHAAEKFCSDYPGGVIDGFVDPDPTQITIDKDCTFQNFTEDNPLTATLNFHTNDPSIYLIIFNNVIFTGNMACANVDHRIWFANGSDYGSHNDCQDLFIPVETIAKQAPGATASIGVPFTYTLTLPSMSWPPGDPSDNNLHTIKVHDDLTETGADLTYLGDRVYLVSGGIRTLLGTDQNLGDSKHLEYTYDLIPAGEQIEIEITVVLDNTPANVPGTSFTNTAKWSFGRLIDDVFYEPLPGEWGVSQPMTIAEPDLVVTKTSDETALNLNTWATYTIDVQNTGGSDAWHATILDEIPDGMCEYDPTTDAVVTAQIFDADGVTPVSGPLEQGLDGDYTVDYDDCRLELNMLSDDAAIGPSERLIITYPSKLDTGFTTDGLALTNVAGATRWFSSDGTHSPTVYTNELSDGTPTVPDFQDSETVTAALAGYYFQKTVENLESGENPATTAAAGDRLRYRLRLFNVDQTITGITISDVLDPVSFDLATFTMTAPPPAGAGYGFDSVTGELTIYGDPDSLDVAVGGEIVVEFVVTLKSNLTSGFEVKNQATLSADDELTAESDDPYVNGIAHPGEPGDPTVVTIQSPGPLSKATTQASATIGEHFKYRITVPAAPVDVPLYDVRIFDDLGMSDADLRFVDANVVSGGSWSLSNTTGTDTFPVIEDIVTGIDIPAGGQAVIDVTVELLNSDTNTRGLPFGNSASFTYNRTNGVAGSETSGGAGSAGNMTVVEPDLTATKTVHFVSPAGKVPGDPATVGDVLEYVVTIPNGGDATAFDTGVADTLPVNLSLIADSAAARIDGTPVSGFVVNPTALPDDSLVWGRRNGDGTLDIPPGGVLVLSYQVSVASITGTEIDNSVYVNWTSLDGANASERTGAGCPYTDAPNDYCYGPVTVSVPTLDNTAITKAAVENSYAETPPGAENPVVRVGDTVTYELTLNLQEYTTRSVVVEDTLPGGMALESFTIDAGTNFSYSLTTFPEEGDTGMLEWVFGDITNQPSHDGTPVDKLVIRYVARVVTDAPPAGVVIDDRILLDNQAALSYTGGDPAVDPGRLTATETIDVRQPRMTAISKVDTGSGRNGTGTMADPYQVNLGSDVMQFQLSSCNEGLAPAYGVVITDQLAWELDETDLAASPPVVRIGATVLDPGVDYTYDAPPSRGEGMRIVLQDSAPVNPGECVTVDYAVGFHTDLTASTSWRNLARLTEYRSLPSTGTGRIYYPTDQAEVWMTNLVNEEQLLKTVVSSADATIGDEVIYRITVPASPMNSAISDVVVTDSLHGALVYVGASAVDGSGGAVFLTDNSVAPGEVNLGVATIPAGGQVIITLTARVLNNDVANAGVSFTNTADYTYAGKPDGLDTASTSGPVTIVEPAVTVSKSVVNVGNPGEAPTAGDILRYSLSFTAEGGEAGDHFSDAFDLFIEDSLGPGMDYQSGTAGVSGEGNTITDPEITGDAATTGQTLTWRWRPVDATADIDVAEGTVVTVTYDVRILDQVQPGQDLTNSVTAQWTGQDGDNAFERNGTGSPEENDYFTGPVTLTVTTRYAISFVKSVVNATTGEDPGANARPGDTLRYTLVVTNESIVPLENPSVVDELAAQFVPGSLQLDTDADTTNCSATGGANGTGIVDIRYLTLGALGDSDDTVTIAFEATLAPVIQNGTSVLNHAELSADNPASATSNETATLIHSAPVFEVLKTSRDMTGDPAQLMPGDTLRYTLTIENIGDEDAVDVRLQDDTPANCTYVAGSTTLNGAALPDLGSGDSPLHDGILVNAPEDTTAGYLPAGAAAGTATVTFDVVVDPDAMEGLIIENQGFVTGSGAGSGPRPEQPSDDPDTPAVDDPTRDIVGNLPLLYAQKTVRILDENDSLVDPGDVLKYTIVISNFGSIPAAGVVLSDSVPANTTYVEGSMTLNDTPLGPDGGVSPLIAGLTVHSDDNPGDGIISAGGSAVITFEVRVDDGVPAGTRISNQGSVASSELPEVLTDADGLPSNGFQPTVIVVGDRQLLEVTKEVAVAGEGPAEPGSQLVYTIRVTNIGSVPATQVVVTDDLARLVDSEDLDPPLDEPVTYVAGSGTMNGSAAGVTYSNPMLTANYAAQYGALPPGESIVVRFRVQIDPMLAIGTTITNTGEVRWNDGTDSAEVSLDVGGTPGSISLGGHVWHDANLDKDWDADTETSMEGWSVALYRNNQLVNTKLTDAEGAYRFTGLLPNEDTGDVYELRFRAAGATPNTPSLGWGDSTPPFTSGPQRISGISAASGASLESLNLPLWPNGVVYDSVVRQPVSGASLALLNAATGDPLPGICFDDPVQQNQVTALDGFYKFDLNFSDAACPAGGAYLIEVTPPDTGYMETPSQVIPPASDASTEPFSVPDCPKSAADAITATDQYCEVLSDSGVPPPSVPPGTDGTRYYLHLLLGDGLIPGHSQVFNNPIPVDPVLDGAVSISKTSSMVNVTRGELVPYTITVTNVYGVPLYDMGILDRMPAGFKYVAGSARLDGEAAEPDFSGRELFWDGLELQVNGKHTLRLLLVVGAGVSEGEFVNRAQVVNTATDTAVSEEATATVLVVPDPDFDCTDVIGKVFDDRNLNGRQDSGEDGLSGVRVVTARGLIATSDEYGRFHITCAAVPDEDRGGNFILKLDERSLPSGYRLTTENPRVQRATRGKIMRFNFGAAIHRVVRLDIADGVFEPGTCDLRLQWASKIAELLEELKKAPSVLRLSYLGDVEGEGLVERRLDALKDEISRQWDSADGGYRLMIETEIYWRRGAPVAGRR